MPGFEVKELEQIVQLAGLELEREDRFIDAQIGSHTGSHGLGSRKNSGACILKDGCGRKSIRSLLARCG